jgi:hypothetical protein
MKDRLDLTEPVQVAGILLVALLVVAILCVNLVDEALMDQQALSAAVLALIMSACLVVKTQGTSGRGLYLGSGHGWWRAHDYCNPGERAIPDQRRALRRDGIALVPLAGPAPAGGSWFWTYPDLRPRLE